MKQNNFLVISGNIKADGLCDQMAQQVMKGATAAGATATMYIPKGLEQCRVCGEGWGICKQQHRCAFGKDGFHDGHQLVKQAQLVCLISPVYWGEVSECLKGFLDKLRRCEFGLEGGLAGKPVLLVASAGGSGNGILSCLEQLDRFCRHTHAIIYDYIGINRWNSQYKKQTLYDVAYAMGEGKLPQ